MTLIEQNYKKLARAVITRAYYDKAKTWLDNDWNFNFFCDLAQVNTKEIKKKFLSLQSLKDEEINIELSKSQIACDLGVSYATLDYWHKKLDSLSEAINHIKNTDHKNLKHSQCDKHYKYIVFLRKQGYSWKNIAEEIGIEYNSLYGFAKKKNIQ